MDDESIRPTASVECPVGGGSPSSISVSIGVNRDVRAQFVTYGGKKASEGADTALAPDLAARMGEAQSLLFTPRSAPDTSIAMEDGRGGTLELEGFLAGPGFTLHRGSFAPGFAMTGSSSLLEHLKLDIYAPNLDNKDGSDAILSKGHKSVGKDLQAATLSGRLKEITEAMIEHWETDRQNESNSLTSQLKSNRHTLNQAGPLEQWYQLLDNSGDLDTPWLEKLKDNPGFNHEFNSSLLATLRNEASGFSQILAKLAADFHLFTQPDRAGGIGRFRRSIDQVTASPTDMNLSAFSFTARGDQPQGLFPVQQVVLRGVSGLVYNPTNTGQSLLGDASGQVLGGFPTEGTSTAGDVLMMSPPLYLRQALPFFTPQERAGRGTESYESFVSSLRNVLRQGADYSKSVVGDMITDLCKAAYAEISLQASTSRLNVPMDLNLWPGDRYTVKNGNGDPLFTGFLNSVHHHMERVQGGGTATSSLTFTHVTYPGFTLPGFS